jgi:hypothetical protein
MNGCLVPVRVTNVHIIHLLDISFMQVALHTERYKCVLFSKDMKKIVKVLTIYLFSITRVKLSTTYMTLAAFTRLGKISKW